MALQCVAWAIALTAAVAQPATNYEPKVGQQGKDVVWVPTPDTVVSRMLDIAQVTPADYVIDLGSGDGRTVIAAAKLGAKSLGIEYEQGLVDVATQNASEAGVSDRAAFIRADIFQADFSAATVLTMFLLPDLNIRLRPTILDMRPGTRVVSNTFTMGDWEPDDKSEAPAANCSSFCRALFWVVPAKVEGNWRFGEEELNLEQKYQVVSGTVKSGGAVHPITNGKLRGTEITFTAGGRRFTGQVNGDMIEGTSGSAGNTSPWRATRS
jgi:SAM-dependent methyltransferase